MTLAQIIKEHRFSLLLLLILISVTYINSLNNAFLSDDLAEIVNNPQIGNIGYAITSRPFGFIRTVSYSLIFNLSGLNPLTFRLLNVLFHAGSVFLVYFLFVRLFSKRLAVFSAAIFAVHPAIAEAVVWISGGSYPQYAFFFLLSFIFYLSAAKSKLFYILSLISYLFSFMSHPQMPLALFLIFPLFELAFGNIKKNWIKSIPFFLLAAVYLLITLSALPERETTLQSVHYQKGGIDNPLLTLPASLSSYFELTLFPKTLTLYHSELSFSQIQFILRALLTLAFFAVLTLSYWKNKFIFFWLSFFLITLSPTLTPFKMNWLVAERYLYLPMVGAAAIIGLGFEKLVASKKFSQAGYVLFMVTILLLSLRTIIRNIDWKNEDNLWIATGKTSPSSPNTHNNLGDVYGRHGDKQAALREFQRAIELKSDYGDAYHNLANTYRELGEVEKALENYQNALKYNPNLWQSYQNTGAIYYELKKFDLALLNFQKAAQINPRNLAIQNAIGIVYLSTDKNKAKEIFEALLKVDPNNQIIKQELQEASK